MANSLEAAFNRQVKKRFPEDDDNSDEDFKEELKRKIRKEKRRRGEAGSGPEMFRNAPQTNESPFAKQMGPPGIQPMFQNRMLPSNMANGGMMPSHHPSRMPFPGPPHFAPYGRPLYPPQFYQNAFNPTAFGRYGMSQPGPQFNRFRYPHHPPQHMAGRMPFRYRMPGKLIPSSVTGGTERERQPQQPHGGPSYYRPQSFNQAFLGYPRNGPMPYGAPGVAPYGQPVIPGREPWRIDRRTLEAAPQRVPSTEGPLREEGKARDSSESTRDAALRPTGGKQASESSDSGEEEGKQGEPKESRPNDRDELSVEGMQQQQQQQRNKVPATLSISHILSGASRDGHHHQESAAAQDSSAQGTPQGTPTPQGAHPMPHASAHQGMRSPDSRDRLTPSNEQFNMASGKGPFEIITGRASYENPHGRSPYRMAPNEVFDRTGPHGDPRRQESYEHNLGKKFNDRKHLGNATESVIMKTPHNTASDLGFYKKMPELRPIREAKDSEEEQPMQDRTVKSVSENGYLEPAITDAVGQRMSGDMNKHLKEGSPRGVGVPYKGWPQLQFDSSSITPGSFLQELNDAGPPSLPGMGGEKPLPDKNNRLPFTSMLRGMNPSQGNPVDRRAEYLSLDAANRARMRENMLMRNLLLSPEEKREKFEAGSRAGDMSAYMYGNKHPSEMIPPALQYRPNISSASHQRNVDPPDMPPGANSQFVDLNSMQYRYLTGLPGSREPMSREQMCFLEQQQRGQMAFSMDAMMAGGQDRMMGFGGMLLQQQLFNAAYASHMRKGQYPGFPSEARNISSHLQDLQSDTVLVSNKTNLPFELRKIALDKGFLIADYPASGNCLFYALSDQLQSVKAIHISHKELRETLVQFLTTNAYLSDGTLLFNFVSGYPSWPEYLQSMAKDGTWGDHVVLFAAANHFQTPIRIISSLNYETVVHPDHAVANTSPLVLGHIHEFHYVSLHPSQESIPSYVLARGQTAVAAFLKAKADGWTVDKRVKVLLIGQDRVGKTSVGRSLNGEKFRTNEKSTEGVEMYKPLKNPGNQPWKNYVLQQETTAFHHKSAEIISREVQSKSTGGQTPKQSLETESQESSNFDATAANSQNSKQALTLKSSMDTNQKDSPSEISDLTRANPFEEDVTASLHSTPDNEQKMENTSLNKRVLMDDKIADLTAEKLHRKETDIPDGVWPVIWDFAGQALFRAIHPIFMSSEAVYVLVWDLTRDLFAKAQCQVNEDGRDEQTILTADSNDTNLDHILRWLDMVHSLRPEGNPELPPVILVGTHADEADFPDEKKEELEEFLRVNFEDFYNHIIESVTVDNTLAGRPIQEEDKRIGQLRQIILKEAEKLSHTQKKIPLKWLEVENNVCDHIKESEDKYMTKQSFKEKIVDQICQPDRDQNLAEHILNFMHDRGTVVYLDHPETPNGLVVLDPQWLVNDVLCKIVTVKNQEGDKPKIKGYRRNLKEKGILNVALLNYACENLNLDGIKKHLILIMRKFNLLCENKKDSTGETEYLVPCMLTRKPEEHLQCHDLQVVCKPVFITFDTNYVPFGLFSRILVLFGQWAAARTSCERPQLFANAARFFIAKTTHLSVRFDCYKRVIKIYILKGTEPNPIHNEQEVLLQASRSLRQILERLKQECHWLRRVSLKLCAQCKLCLKTKNCFWHKEQKCSHEDCTHYVDINDKPFVCVNDLSSNSAIPQTWIQALTSGVEDVKQCVKVKMGTPSNEVLEDLSLRITEKWRQLGRRLRIDEPQLDAFDRENHQCREKAYKMLLSWKQRDGGSDASYQVLYDALCHNLVGLRKLAKEICCD